MQSHPKEMKGLTDKLASIGAAIPEEDQAAYPRTTQLSLRTRSLRWTLYNRHSFMKNKSRRMF